MISLFRASETHSFTFAIENFNELSGKSILKLQKRLSMFVNSIGALDVTLGIGSYQSNRLKDEGVMVAVRRWSLSAVGGLQFFLTFVMFDVDVRTC